MVFAFMIFLFMTILFYLIFKRIMLLKNSRRLLAAIHDPLSIEKVLGAMKLPFHAPELAPARAPPAEEGTWWGA